MSLWIWILIIIIILVLAVAFAVFYIWDPTYYFVEKRAKREVKRMTPAELEEQREAADFRACERARMMALQPGETATMMGIAELIRYSDILGLRSVFNLAGTWQKRELVIVALGNLYRDSPQMNESQQAVLMSALKDIVELCKAETSGGTYRQNCLEHAQLLINRLKMKIGVDVILQSAGSNRIDVIKAIREITGLGLKDCKDLIDSAPIIIKEKLPKHRAEEICQKLKDAGAMVEIR